MSQALTSEEDTADSQILKKDQKKLEEKIHKKMKKGIKEEYRY